MNNESMTRRGKEREREFARLPHRRVQNGDRIEDSGAILNSPDTWKFNREYFRGNTGNDGFFFF